MDINGGSHAGETGQLLGNRSKNSKRPACGSCTKYIIIVGLSVLLIILMVCFGFFAAVLHYQDDTDSTMKHNTTMTIAPSTIMEIDLWKHSMDTLHRLNVSIATVANDLKGDGCSSLQFAVSNEHTCIYKQLDTAFTSKLQEPMSLLRQWLPSANPTGVITSNSTTGDYIVWKWGNLTHPPQRDCSLELDKNDSLPCPANVTDIIKKRPSNSSDGLLRIYFCTDTDYAHFNVSITECLPSPDRSSYQTYYIDDKEDQTVKFHNYIHESFKHSKLYVNTEHLKEEVQLKFESTPDHNTQHTVIALVILGITLVILFITLLIVIVLSCRRKRNGEEDTVELTCQSEKQFS